jgi:signal transduction histidine kinase/CheY-like chemotaxis protein
MIINSKNGILTATQQCLLIPYYSSFNITPSKYYIPLLPVVNGICVFYAKQQALSVFNGYDRELQLRVLNNYFNGLIINLITGWIFSLLNKRRFEAMEKELIHLSSELTAKSNLFEEMKEELLMSKTKPVEELKVKNAILTTVSHELKRPISSLISSLEKIHKIGDQSQNKELLKSVKICGETRLNLISTFVRDANIKSNDFIVESPSTDIYKLVSSAWTKISMKMKQKKIKGWLYVSKNLSRYIVADSQKISQILLNLLRNPVKSTNDGEIRFYVDWCEEGADYQGLFEPNPVYSKINSVSTCEDSELDSSRSSSMSEHRAEIVRETDEFSQYQSVKSKYLKYKPSNCEINMSTTQFYVFSDSSTDINETLCKNSQINSRGTTVNTGYLRCEVFDTGCGISESTLNQLFSTFTQEDSSVRRKYEDTSLGLFTAKKLIPKLNAEIRVQTIKNVGSEIIVCLKSCSGEPIEPNSVKQLPILKRRRALIVDNDFLNQQILSKYLNKLKISYEIAEDGEEAYLKFMEHEEGYYSLITMNIRIPPLDGICTAQLIRKFEHTYPIRKIPVPIIFIGTDAKESKIRDTMDEIRTMQAAAFYKKPLRFVEFETLINSID